MTYPTTVETLPTNHSTGQVIDPAFDNDQARIVNAVQAQTVTGGTHSLPDHVAAADPHTQYQKESERDQTNGYAGLGATQTVHPSFLGTGTRDGTKVLRDDGVWAANSSGDVASHAAAADPHAGYQKETEKNAANGYAGLNASARVATANLGSGTGTSANFLRGDSSWSTPSTASIEPEIGSAIDWVTVHNKGYNYGVDPRVSFAPGTLQTLINAAGANATVTIPNGVYREAIDLSYGGGRNLTLTAETAHGVSIRGSEYWGDFCWTKEGLTTGAQHWESREAPPVLTPDSVGFPLTPEAISPYMVFCDGLPLKKAADNTMPKPGYWSMGENRRIMLADDPIGHCVEVTVRHYAVECGYGGAQIPSTENPANYTPIRMTLNGINVMHCSSYNLGAGAAIAPGAWNNNSGLLARLLQMNDCDVVYNHGTGVGGTVYPGSYIRDSKVNWNGGTGINLSQVWPGVYMPYNATCDVSDNEISWNGYLGYDSGFGSGGTKFSQMNRMTCNNNVVMNNSGPGLWWDIENTEITAQGNVCAYNMEAGMMFEISGWRVDGARAITYRGAQSLFENNVVYENRWGRHTRHGNQYMTGGIFISTSDNVIVRNNTVAWNYWQISVIWDWVNRVATSPAYMPIADAPVLIHVHSNDVIGEDQWSNSGPSSNDSRLVSFFELAGGTGTMVASASVGGWLNRGWTGVYSGGESVNPDGVAGATTWSYGGTDYNTLAGFNATKGGNLAAGGATTLIVNTGYTLESAQLGQRMIPPSAVRTVLTTAGIPTSPQRGHGWSYTDGLTDNHPRIPPITSALTVVDQPMVVVDTTAGSVVVTLPNPQKYGYGSGNYELLVVKTVAGNTVTLTPAGGTTCPVASLTAADSSVLLVSDGTVRWRVKSLYP